MSLDWYPFFAVDYRRDTYHLSLAEDGAYRRLIDEYMMTREALPNDNVALARILGIPTTEWEELAPRIRPFFKSRNDKLIHKRCEQELRAQDTRSSRYSDRAKKAAMTKWLKHKGLNAKRMLNGATLHNTSKTTTSEYDAEAEGCPKGNSLVSAELAAKIKQKWG